METLPTATPAQPGVWVEPDDDPTSSEGYELAAGDEAAPAAAAVRSYKEASIDLLHLAPGARVLDVGCGVGGDLARLAERVGARGLVAGVDTSPTMLARARSRTANLSAPVKLSLGSAYELEFPDATFDAARADRVLHFLPRPDAVLSELARVVRVGGRVVVSEPDHDTMTLDTTERVLTTRLLAHRRSHVTSPTPGRRLRRLFLDAGFRGVEITAHTVVATDLAIADRFLGLSRLLQSAVANQVFAPIDALRWHVAATRDGEAGRFLAAISVFTVAGVRAGS